MIQTGTTSEQVCTPTTLLTSFGLLQAKKVPSNMWKMHSFRSSRLLLSIRTLTGHIATEKRGYLHNIFPISQQKHRLWVCREIRKISTFFGWKKRLNCCYANSEGPDQTACQCSLNWDFAFSICPLTYFCMTQPIRKDIFSILHSKR